MLVNLSLMHPRLMHTLVLLDPVVSRFASTPEGPNFSPAARSHGRQDLWPSRAAAEASFRRSKFFSAWDKRVLDAWCTYGIAPTPTRTHPDKQDGEVTLTTSKHQELFTFFRPSWPAFNQEGKELVHPHRAPDIVFDDEFPNAVHFPFYRPEGPLTRQNLPFVRPSVLYVFGDKSEVSPPVLREEKMQLTGIGAGGSGGAAIGRVKEVLLEGIGHLVAMDVPTVCAQHASDWIAQEMRRWWSEDKEWQEWKQKPDAEKVRVSEEWGPRLGKKGPSKL